MLNACVQPHHRQFWIVVDRAPQAAHGSQILCTDTFCGKTWRTRAAYVATLPDIQRCRCHGEPLAPCTVAHLAKLAAADAYDPNGDGRCAGGYNPAHDSCPHCDAVLENLTDNDTSEPAEVQPATPGAAHDTIVCLVLGCLDDNLGPDPTVLHASDWEGVTLPDGSSVLARAELTTTGPAVAVAVYDGTREQIIRTTPALASILLAGKVPVQDLADLAEFAVAGF